MPRKEAGSVTAYKRSLLRAHYPGHMDDAALTLIGIAIGAAATLVVGCGGAILPETGQ